MKAKVKRALARLQPGQVAIVEWRGDFGNQRFAGTPELAAVGRHIKRIIWTARDGRHAMELLRRDVEGRQPHQFGIIRCRKTESDRSHRLCLLDAAAFGRLVAAEEILAEQMAEQDHHEPEDEHDPLTPEERFIP